MTDDLVKRGRFLAKRSIDGDLRGTALQMADRIEALQAERCVEVRPLEWFEKPEGQKERIGRCDQTSYSVSFDFGGWGYRRRGETGFVASRKGAAMFVDEHDAMAGANEDHVERILSAITTRPASKVRAEAHAAAIEAAADAISILPENGNAGPPQDGTDRLLDAQRRLDAKAIRALHTDASLAAIERIKREAREEALRDMLGLTINHAPERDDIHAAIMALIEKEGV